MCPGTPFPVKPWLPLVLCRTCPLYEFGHAMTGPATHDGKRWSCPKISPRTLAIAHKWMRSDCMGTVSAAIAERSRKNVLVILRALAAISQTQVASEFGDNL